MTISKRPIRTHRPGPSAPAQADSQLSPAMKALIADEVRQQLAAEKAAGRPPPRAANRQPEQLPPALNRVLCRFVES